MEVILIIATTAFIIIAIFIAMIKPKESSNTPDQPQKPDQSNIQPFEEVTIPSNKDGYFYHEMVGMHYRGITPKDFGVYKGTVIAEANNPHDKFAVGIYRGGDNKLVGYIPKDFRGVSNEKIHGEIKQSGGSRDVVFKISGNDNRCYGALYIKIR